VEIGDEGEDESMSSERWLSVECHGSVEAYRDMEFFIGISDASRAYRLAKAIDGRAPFRRFSDALEVWPEEIDRWMTYSEERQRGRAWEWLAEHGYCTTPSADSLAT
jgi:hypothetical protein